MLAGRLGRVVSIHCVKANGAIFEIMKKLGPALPPRIMMHSWGGTADSAKSLLCLKKGVGKRFYFSFSSTINSRSPKTLDVIKSIPEDRLLIESDHVVGMDDRMEEAVDMVCKAKGWTEDFCEAQMTENANRFFFGENEKN